MNKIVKCVKNIQCCILFRTKSQKQIIATDDIMERLYSLRQGEKVIARIEQNVVYRALAEEPAIKCRNTGRDVL